MSDSVWYSDGFRLFKIIAGDSDSVGFYTFTVRTHIGVWSSMSNICLSRIPVVQNSTATCLPSLNSRYIFSGQRKAWKAEAKQSLYMQRSVEATSGCNSMNITQTFWLQKDDYILMDSIPKMTDSVVYNMISSRWTVVYSLLVLLNSSIFIIIDGCCTSVFQYRQKR